MSNTPTIPINHDGFPGSCWECRYWSPGGNFFGEPMGECRRNAPIAVADARNEWLITKEEANILGQQEYEWRVASWPRTMHDYWCGQFEPRFASQIREGEDA